MLTQDEIDMMIEELKWIKEKDVIGFPNFDHKLTYELESEFNPKSYLLDANRKGSLDPMKISYQFRFRASNVIIRLDLNGPPHTNPDSTEVGRNHIHIAREGYNARWAYALPDDVLNNSDDLIDIFKWFLSRCNISHTGKIKYQESMIT